jgi:hypothetical protein
MISVSESTWLSHSKLMEGKTSASYTSSSVNGGKLKSFWLSESNDWTLTAEGISTELSRGAQMLSLSSLYEHVECWMSLA